MFDVVILTEKKYINPKVKDWYIDQVLLEDKLLQKELEKKGMKVCKRDWTDTNFDWKSSKYAIFRTTWDYFERFDEFLLWMKETKHKIKFINSYEIINWNIDKYYLKDLSKNGINIVPTLFLKKGKKVSLKQLFTKTKWKEVVIKPTISGAARNTYHITENNFSDFEDIFQQIINEESMLFQQFMKNILTQGEISLIMIGGKYTHAVKKTAKKGDFRVQDDHGGKVEIYNATQSEIKFAEDCIEKCPFSPIYARVDILYNNESNLSLIELELIEPELWFRNNKFAAWLLAEKIYKKIYS